MTTSSLPNLHADLHWLIHMPPTYEALDDYLKGHAPTWTHEGAHLIAFSISNIFYSPHTASPYQRQYDLEGRALIGPPVGRGLADELDTRLLQADAHDNRSLQEWLDGLTRFERAIHLHAIGARETLKHTDKLDPDKRAQLDARRRTNIALDAEDVAEHNLHIRSFCKDLRRCWQDVLKLYEMEPGNTPLHPLGKSLYLLPSVERPSLDLLDKFADGGMTLHLLLLTARHELGYLYKKVKAWHERSLSTWGPRADDPALDSWDLGLISARSRGFRFFTAGSVNDSDMRLRKDLPVAHVHAPSDIALLYHGLSDWFERAYYLTLELRRCETCHRPLPAYNRQGRPEKYCDDDCKRKALRQARARAKKAQDAREQVEGPSPYKQLKGLSRNHK